MRKYDWAFGIECVLVCALAVFSGCAPAVEPDGASPAPYLGTPSPVEILEAPEIAAEITAQPMETATPDPALDAELLLCARNTGNVSEDNMRAVLRCMSKADPTGYLAWLTGEGRMVTFYRQVPFENGTLVLAMEPFDGEIDPALYYVLEGRVAAQSYGADCWSLDMVRFLGKTIVFGPVFAQLPGSGKVIASFFDGQILEQSLVGGETSYDQGFILIADGTPDLKTLTLFSGSTPVADNSASVYQLRQNTGRTGTPLAVFDAVHLCAMSDKAPDWAGNVISVTGGVELVYEVPFTKYFKNAGGWVYTDAWRNNNALNEVLTVPGGAQLELGNVPGSVMAAYIVDPTQDNGADTGASKARRSVELTGGKITLPTLAGGAHVFLLIETADAVHSLAIFIK